MLIKKVFAILFTWMVLQVSGQEAPKDSLLVTQSLHIESISLQSTKEQGLQGIKIRLDLAKTISLQDSLYVHFTLNNKPYKRTYSHFQSQRISQIDIFYPFALLCQKQGAQVIEFDLLAITKAKEKTTYSLAGQLSSQITVVVPRINTLQLKVNYLEVAATNAKGDDWDFNFFGQSKEDEYPDLMYSLQSPFNPNSQGLFNGIFYESHRQKNTLVAGWPYFSETIHYCEGDILRICIKDVDLIFHDTIGCISLNELQGLASASNTSFGLVKKFSWVLEE